MRGGFEKGHVMLLRGATITLWLLASWTFGHGQAITQQVPAQPACTVAAFETQPEATVAACTAVLDKAGLSDPTRAETLKIRARSLHTTGRLDDAIKDYDTALDLAPNDPELHLRRGWTAYDKADFKTVFDQANEAIRLKPDYADAYDLVGATLARREVGRRHEAMAVFAEAIRLDPNVPLFHIHLMDVSECCGMPEEALREADAVLHLPVAAITKPNATEFYFKRTSFRTVASLERARMLAVLGRNDEAKQAYDQAVHDDPDALPSGSNSYKRRSTRFRPISTNRWPRTRISGSRMGWPRGSNSIARITPRRKLNSRARWRSIPSMARCAGGTP